MTTMTAISLTNPIGSIAFLPAAPVGAAEEVDDVTTETGLEELVP